MRSYVLQELQEVVTTIERLADDRDLLLEEIKTVLGVAEQRGFDRDALVAMICCRLEGTDPASIRHKTALKYLHALGDLPAKNREAA